MLQDFAHSKKNALLGVAGFQRNDIMSCSNLVQSLKNLYAKHNHNDGNLKIFFVDIVTTKEVP